MSRLHNREEINYPGNQYRFFQRVCLNDVGELCIDSEIKKQMGDVNDNLLSLITILSAATLGNTTNTTTNNDNRVTNNDNRVTNNDNRVTNNTTNNITNNKPNGGNGGSCNNNNDTKPPTRKHTISKPTKVTYEFYYPKVKPKKVTPIRIQCHNKKECVEKVIRIDLSSPKRRATEACRAYKIRNDEYKQCINRVEKSIQKSIDSLKPKKKKAVSKSIGTKIVMADKTSLIINKNK